MNSNNALLFHGASGTQYRSGKVSVCISYCIITVMATFNQLDTNLDIFERSMSIEGLPPLACGSVYEIFSSWLIDVRFHRTLCVVLSLGSWV